MYNNCKSGKVGTHLLLKQFQKGLKIFHVWCFFYGWEKKTSKWCTWKIFWPFLLFDGFSCYKVLKRLSFSGTMVAKEQNVCWPGSENKCGSHWRFCQHCNCCANQTLLIFHILLKLWNLKDIFFIMGMCEKNEHVKKLIHSEVAEL